MFLLIIIIEINFRLVRKEILFCVILIICIGVFIYLRNIGLLGEVVIICGKICK